MISVAMQEAIVRDIAYQVVQILKAARLPVNTDRPGRAAADGPRAGARVDGRPGSRGGGMRWFLIMWVYVGGYSPGDHGVLMPRVEMHLSELGCEWARQEAILARGYVARAWCESRPRSVLPQFYWPMPRRPRPAVAEVRP